MDLGSLAQGNSDAARVLGIYFDKVGMMPDVRARWAQALTPLKHDVVGDVGTTLWALRIRQGRRDVDLTGGDRLRGACDEPPASSGSRSPSDVTLDVGAGRVAMDPVDGLVSLDDGNEFMRNNAERRLANHLARALVLGASSLRPGVTISD